MKLDKTMLLSTISLKCPRCRQGYLFKNRNPYALKELSSMNKTCSNCKMLLDPEPSFYYGSMYVSYALTVGFSILTFLIWYFFFDVDVMYYLIFNAIFLLALVPYTFQLARAVWITILVKYNPASIEPNPLKKKD